MTDIPLLNGLIYAGLGIAVFIFTFALLAKLAPFNLWKEITKGNIAAAIFAGAIALGICWIVAAAVH